MHDDVVVRGVGMTRFGRHLDQSMKELGRAAIEAALADADCPIDGIEALVFSNSLAGLITGQECIRGETIAYPLGLGGIPIHNVENACASAGNALHLAWLMVASGQHDTVLALGVEKANHVDKARMFSAYGAGTDVETGFSEDFVPGQGAGSDRTPLVDRQAVLARRVMEERGLTSEDLVTVTARAYANAARNPMAHRQFGASPAEIRDARMVVPPLTSLMSSPVSDGAAAAVVTRGGGGRDIRILASQMASRPARGSDGPPAATLASQRAFEQAGIGPGDLDLAEVHDASVAYELIAWHDTGICPPGDEARWIATGRTSLAGELPVNPSGGLIARGHAIGASGLAQVHEIALQLRGEAGSRQIAGDPGLALAQIGGGVIDWETAVASVHVLAR